LLMILSKSRLPPRIKSGTGILEIMRTPFLIKPALRPEIDVHFEANDELTRAERIVSADLVS